MGASATIGLYLFPSFWLFCGLVPQMCLERLCHFLFQLSCISIRHTPAAALQALTKGLHLAVLTGNGVRRALEGAEQECDVLALTDAVIHPAGVFNPIVHYANHHVGSLRVSLHI